MGIRLRELGRTGIDEELKESGIVFKRELKDAIRQDFNHWSI